jgi:hypothetical protein
MPAWGIELDGIRATGLVENHTPAVFPDREIGVFSGSLGELVDLRLCDVERFLPGAGLFAELEKSGAHVRGIPFFDQVLFLFERLEVVVDCTRLLSNWLATSETPAPSSVRRSSTISSDIFVAFTGVVLVIQGLITLL